MNKRTKKFLKIEQELREYDDTEEAKQQDEEMKEEYEFRKIRS